MKGLLLKDWYMALKNCRFLILFALTFIILGAATGEGAISPFYPMIVCGTLPISLYSFDEKSRWNAYATGLPVSGRQIVTVKYIEVAISALGVLALSLIAYSVRLLALGGSDFRALLRAAALWLLAGVFSPCVMLPIVLRFGSEKGRIAYYVIMFALIGALMAFNETFFNVTGLGMSLTSLSAAIMLAASAALMVVSWAVSVKLFEGKAA